MGKCLVSSSREQHCWDPGTPTHYEPPKNSLFYFLTWVWKTKWQFRAAGLVKKETACGSSQYMQLRSGLDFTALFDAFYLWCTMRVQNVTWDNFSSEDAEGSLGYDSCCLEGRFQITTAASNHLFELCPGQNHALRALTYHKSSWSFFSFMKFPSGNPQQFIILTK